MEILTKIMLFLGDNLKKCLYKAVPMVGFEGQRWTEEHHFVNKYVKKTSKYTAHLL